MSYDGPTAPPENGTDGDSKEDRSFEARYGKVIVSRGIAAFPSLLLRWRKDLGLANEPLIALLVIFSFYRTAGDTPSVPISRFADWLDVSGERAEKVLDYLIETKGYLRRAGRDYRHGGSYRYDLSPLLKVLHKLALAEEKSARLREQHRELSRGLREEALRDLSTEGGTNRDQ